MKFRKFGQIDWDVSVLGLSVEKLPVFHASAEVAEIGRSVNLIRQAIDCGVNYIDLGFPFQGEKQTRALEIARQALADGYRDRVKIAVTLPVSYIESPDAVDRYIENTLEKLNIKTLDFLVVGRLNRDNMDQLRMLKVFDYFATARAVGTIDHLGFSFHDHFQILKQVIDMYENWSFCQFQYSYMDVDHDPGISGIKYAADNNLAVVVAEPLRGGRLANVHCEAVLNLWEQAPNKRSYEEWGIHFAWNDPGVSTVVPEIESEDQLDRFLAMAGAASPDNIGIRDELVINQVREAYAKLAEIPCPSCRPCMPCEEGIDVPRIFEIYNDSLIYGDLETARRIYANERHKGEDCTECGLCAERCAKELDIVSLLNRAVRRLT